MKTIKKNQIRFAFDASVPPVEYAESGETLCFQTQDCYAEQIDYDNKDAALIDEKRDNPVTGPLYINGAEPGDVLRVEIIEITPEDHGVMRLQPGKGVYEIKEGHCRRFPIKDGTVIFDENVQIPIRPMIGVIGTCPADACDTLSPGAHGGNLDIKDLGEGSTIYLPVIVPGALLSIGDCHAVQGDGETAICAMEVSASITVRVTVLKNRNDIPTPFVENDHAIFTTFADESLDVAHAEAAQRMHRYLTETTKWTDTQAAMILSLAGDLRISQVVNPKKGCIMEFPKRYLPK